MHDLESKSKQYRDIRKRVLEDATYASDPMTHKENKFLLKKNILKVCNKSLISIYHNDSEDVRNMIWNQLWTKIRYAGIKAITASKEIEDIALIFNKYSDFSKPEWDIEIEWDRERRKHVLKQGGKYIHDYLTRSGVFFGKRTVGNLVKLKKTVRLARSYNKYISANEKPLYFVTAGADIDDVWGIHSHLQEIGYTSDLTALHFMMDIGLPVIKPDIVIARLFLTLGWLHDIISDLPSDLAPKDLVGKGKYKTRYQYTNPKIYKPVIDLSRQVINFTRKEDLISDIGWSTKNPVREFDIFIVKFGQEPEEQWGLTRNLSKEMGNNISNISKCPSSSG